LLPRANGGIRWNKDWVNVLINCAGEYVGPEKIDDGIWNVHFGALKLGRLLERHIGESRMLSDD
jgi:putative transposase